MTRRFRKHDAPNLSKKTHRFDDFAVLVHYCDGLCDALGSLQGRHDSGSLAANCGGGLLRVVGGRSPAVNPGRRDGRAVGTVRQRKLAAAVEALTAAQKEG